jgi:histidine phosphotransferase ChpT
MAKNNNLTLAGPDLAALLCSRVCHDIISPVGRYQQRTGIAG